MRCASSDVSDGLGFHEYRSGSGRRQSVDRADDGTAGREAGVPLLDERPATDDDRAFAAAQGAPCRASGSFIGVRGDQLCHAARRSTPGGSAVAGATRATRMLEAVTPLPTISAVLGHADPDSTWFGTQLRTVGNAWACVLPGCRKAIVMRLMEHGFVGLLAGELRSTSASRRPWAGMAPPRPGPAPVRPACLEHGAVRLERGVVS